MPRRIACAMAALWLALPPQPLNAQAPDGNLIHWAYSSYFGTGRYELSGNQSVYALRVRPRWQWREAELDANGERKLGIEFRIPLSVSTHEFDLRDLSGTVATENVSAISIVPGVEIEIPITERWTLKPLGYVGWGTEFGSDASARIYWAGLKSRYSFRSGELDWAIVNSLVYFGYSPDSGPSENATPLMIGFEFQRPLADKRIGNDQIYLNWHVSYVDNLDELSFGLGVADQTRVDIANEWELGIAFSKGKRPLKFWRLEWDRVGIAYRFSSERDFSGVRLVFSSLFDR